MTMLGMQADIQCHYFLGYCSTKDINLNASCSIWPSSNVDRVEMNGHYYNGNLAPPSPDQYLAYKDKLKQVMLQHEAIFKNQVHELHRLYNKQRYLMDEMKRNQFHGQQLHLETSTFNQIVSENCFDYSQKACKVSAFPWQNPTHSQSFVPLTENNVSHINYVEGNDMLADCTIVQTKESELLESKCKKVGKKILDLELPAYEYIDSEPDEYLDDELIRPEVTRTSFPMESKCLADLNEPIKLEEETEIEFNDFLCPVQDLPAKGNSDFQFQPEKVNENAKTREDPQELQIAVQSDRNEDQQDCLYDNDEAGQSSSNLNSFPERALSEEDDIAQGHGISESHLLKLKNRKVQNKRKYYCLESYSVQDANASASKQKSGELITLDDDSSSFSSWRKHTHDIVRAPFVVQALPCFNTSVRLCRSSKLRNHHITCQEINLESEPDEFTAEDASTKNHIKGSLYLKSIRDIDLNCMSPSCSSDVDANNICFTDGEEKCKESTYVANLNKKLDLYRNSVPESGKKLDGMNLVSVSRHDRKFSGSKFCVDLNSCTNENDSSMIPSLATEVDLQAPESPENMERSPPRGESDENQPDMPMLENGNLIEDLVVVAAEAIVSISSSEVQVQIQTFSPPEALKGDSLYWFAKLASSVVDNAESEFGIVLSRKSPDHHCNGMDYFEAMTLQLEATKVEEYSCKPSIEEEAVCPAPLPRRGRTRRGRQQRKDFQSEILPSLASLSRYEVTKDLQAIGGLIEAAHCSNDGRRIGRNGCRGRRKRPSVTYSRAETSVSMLVKQQSGHGECGKEERSLIDWGKITTRRRGQRCPARLVLSQV